MRNAIGAAIASLMLSLPCASLADTENDFRDMDHSRDIPYPVELFTGETFKVCESGQIVCPATRPICDDPKVAAPVDTPDGLGFMGVGPGTTLCSGATASGQRRVFRIIVR
jgi:hypothetical protein